MRVLHVFNKPRSGGGSLASTLATIDLSRKNGLTVDSFSFDSSDLPVGLLGKIEASTSAFYSPKSERAFLRKIKEFKPDIVHCNEFFPLVSARIPKLCQDHKIPVVMTCDDYHLTCPTRNHFIEGQVCTACLDGNEYNAIRYNCRNNMPESIINSLYNYRIRIKKLFKNYVDHYITCSEFSRSWLIEHAGINATSITSIPHVIEIPKTMANPEKGSYASFGGRFVPEKGIDVLLEAGQKTDIPVKVSRNAKHFVTIDLPNDADIVVTNGRDDLAEFYRNAQFLVFPSIWFETYGVVGAESMSHGIPVIASRLGALNDLIEDGVDGLLFEPGNSQDLADKMLQLWNQPKRLKEMGLAARRKAIDLWSEEPNFKQTLSVYHQVLN